MKTIIIGEKKIELDMGEELTMKNLRSLSPVLVKYNETMVAAQNGTQTGEEIEMIYGIVLAIAIDKDKAESILDSLIQSEIEILSSQIGEILTSSQKKTNE